MNNVEKPQYSEYRLNDVIDRLEGFRNTIGWGQLNEDLEVAIDCLEYTLKVIEEDVAIEFKAFEISKQPHWIVDDHGFAGKYFRCSVCGKGYWTGSYAPHVDIHVADRCMHCKTVMDLDNTEYREAT